jgi:hypothetical protein
MSEESYVAYPQDLKQKALRKMGANYEKLMRKTGRVIPTPAIFVNEKKWQQKYDKGTETLKKPQNQKIVNRFKKHEAKINQAVLRDASVFNKNWDRKGFVKAGTHAVGSAIKGQAIYGALTIKKKLMGTFNVSGGSKVGSESYTKTHYNRPSGGKGMFTQPAGSLKKIADKFIKRN